MGDDQVFFLMYVVACPFPRTHVDALSYSLLEAVDQAFIGHAAYFYAISCVTLKIPYGIDLILHTATGATH